MAKKVKNKNTSSVKPGSGKKLPNSNRSAGSSTAASKTQSKNGSSKPKQSAASSKKNTGSVNKAAVKSSPSKSAAPKSSKSSYTSEKKSPSRTKASKPASSEKRPSTAKKVVIIAIIAALAVSAGLFANYYYKNVTHYREHFFDGTFINGADVSQMSAEQAKQTIQDSLNNYSFTFTDHEQRSDTVTAEMIDLTYTDNGEVDSLLSAQDAFHWISRKEEAVTYNVTAGYTYNKDKLLAWIHSLPCLNDGTASTNAYEYQAEDGYWYVEPETYGDEIRTSVVEDLIIDCVDNARSEANLEGVDCFIGPEVTVENASLDKSVQEKNDAINAAIAAAEARAARIEEITDVTIKFNSCFDKVTLGKKELLSMVIDDENGDPIIDESQVKDWVVNWAQERNLNFQKDMFVTHGGKLVSVAYGPLSGWTVDIDKTAQRTYEAVINRNSCTIHPVMVDSNGYYLEDQTYVEINISKQRMWFYQNGTEIVDTPIVTGDVVYGMDTPSFGVWSIYYKTTDFTMRGPLLSDGSYEYEVFVHYWMPFNGQIGIHDHPLREDFGGEIYKGNGSHGCINTPYDAVRTIYENAPVGTLVVIHGE